MSVQMFISLQPRDYFETLRVLNRLQRVLDLECLDSTSIPPFPRTPGMNREIKRFIDSTNDFKKNNNNELLIESLQNLITTDNLSIFDPGSFGAAEFYTLLHDLLILHSNNDELVFCIINLLQVAMQNTNANYALVHTYHFINPLTRLLDTYQASEKKLIILKLIQELSYGMVISWQENHLPKLIGILLDSITSDESELTPIALGVLVNLCHKNKPAIYTLNNCVNIKTFLRHILNLQRANVETSVQVCKLLIILDQLSGNVPDAEILSFVRVSFLRINKAFRCGNTSLMRSIVDFFRDAKESKHGREVLLSYPTYQDEVNNLMNTLSDREKESVNYQCVYQLVVFVQQLIELELAVLAELFPKVAQTLLPWAQNHITAPCVIDLLSTMLRQSQYSYPDFYKDLCSCLENHLQVFVEMLHEGCSAKPSGSEQRAMTTSLLNFFRQLASNPSLAITISATVDKRELKKLLMPLTDENNEDRNHFFEQSVITLYVEVLSLVAELSKDDVEWLYLYVDFLQKKQILKTLAVALYSGTFEVKKKILFLAGTSSFSKDCLTVLSKFMADLNQLFPVSSTVTNYDASKSVSCPVPQLDFTPYLAKADKENIEKLIEKLNDLCQKNKLQEAPLVGIIELYQLKVADMRRGESTLQCSLAAADRQRTQLSHQVAHLTAETSRLHQLLYTAHQNIEGFNMEREELRQQLLSAKQSASSSHDNIKQLKQDVHAKSMIINEQNQEVLKLKEYLEKSQTNCKHLEQKSTNLDEKVEELEKCVRKLDREKSELQTSHLELEDKLGAFDKLLLEKDGIIEYKASNIQSLEQEITNQKLLGEGLEKNLKEKDKELTALQSQLVEFERMRKIIFEITGGKK